MRFLTVLILIVAGIAGIGFYRGWFDLSSDRGADKSNVTLTVDRDKMKEDKQRAVDKVQDLGHQAKDRAEAAVQPATNPK